MFLYLPLPLANPTCMSLKPQDLARKWALWKCRRQSPSYHYRRPLHSLDMRSTLHYHPKCLLRQRGLHLGRTNNGLSTPFRPFSREEVNGRMIFRVTELATGVNATAPVGPVAQLQGPSTTFLVDPQGRVLHRDAGGSLQFVAELVYHNKDKGILEKGAGNYKSRLIECRRKGPATFDSPIVPANWPKLIGDLFMVHLDKRTEGMWFHQGDGKWTNITHHWNSVSLDANHSVQHPSNSAYRLTRTKDFPNWILLQSQVDKEKKRQRASASSSHVSFGSATTYPAAA